VVAPPDPIYNPVDNPGQAYNPTYGMPSVVGPQAPPPPPAAPPRNPYSFGGPTKLQLKAGYTPNYQSLIENDPAYLAAKNAAAGAATTAAGRRTAALRSAFIRYGGVPSGFNDTYGDIDQTTRDAASGNQNSVLAQLAYNYKQSGEQFKRQLSARGMLQSGELGYGQDQLNRGYSQNQYEAGNSFLDEAGRDVTDYTGVLGQNAKDLSGAIGQAESNVYSNPAYRPIEASYANYDPEMSSAFAMPIYKSDDGSWYRSDGNPFDIVQGY
jgi:hypothetical protein